MRQGHCGQPYVDNPNQLYDVVDCRYKATRMKAFRNLFTNPWFVFAIVLYVGSLFVLSRRTEVLISEALIELIIFGIAFPSLAWLATMPARCLTMHVHPAGAEMLALLAYVLGLSVYLAFGPQTI